MGVIKVVITIRSFYMNYAMVIGRWVVFVLISEEPFAECIAWSSLVGWVLAVDVTSVGVAMSPS